MKQNEVKGLTKVLKFIVETVSYKRSKYESRD